MLRLCALTLMLAATCNAATPDWPAADWQADYQHALAHGVARRLLVGYPDMTFRPNQIATRYEGAAVISRLLWYYLVELPKADLLPPDVPWDHWCADACRVLVAAEVAPAPYGVRFAGERALTRGEFALMEWNLVQALRGAIPPKRLSDIASPYEEAAQALQAEGLMQPYPDGGLYPEARMPRWQVCVAVEQLLTWQAKRTAPPR